MKAFRLIGVLLLLSVMMAPIMAQDEDVTVSLPEVTMAQGETVDVEVIVDCPDGSCNIFRGSIGFDPTIISIDEIKPGDYIGESITLLPNLNVIDNQLGTIEFFLSNTRRSTDITDGVLMTLTVTAKAEGFSPLIFTPDPVELVVKSGSRDVSAAVVDGSVDVTPPPTPAPELARVDVRQSNDLHVLPDADSEMIMSVPAGSTLEVLAANEDFSWLLVRGVGDASEIAGWLSVNLFVTLSGDVEAIPALAADEIEGALERLTAETIEVTEQPTESPTDEPTQSPTESPADEPTESPTEESPTDAPTDTPPTSTTAPTDTPEPTQTIPPTVTAAPSSTSTPSATTPPTVTIAATATVAPTTTLPPTVTVVVATETPSATPTPEIVEVFIVNRTENQNVNVRDGAGRGFAVVGIVPRDTVLDIVKEVDNGGGDLWYMVTLPDGQVGYISAVLGSIAYRVEGAVQTLTPSPSPTFVAASAGRCQQWAVGTRLKIETPPGVVDVFLRASPRSNETRWVSLQNQTPVVVTGRPSGTQCWWPLRTEGRTGGDVSGWVEEGYLRLR